MRKGIFVLGWFLAINCFVVGTSPGENEIRIGYLQSDIHQLSCWVALDKGFYKGEGLNVKVAGIFKAGPELMSAFAAGALDIGYVGLAPATTSVANGVARVKVLAQVNTEGTAIVVRADSGISSLADLKGKRIGVPGHSTVQDFLLRKAMASCSFGKKEIRITVLKPPEMIGALRTSQIDAFVAWEPYPAKVVTMGVGKVLVYSREIWKDHPCCVLVADERFLTLRINDAKKMVRAHVKATDFINAHPDEAMRIGVKYTGMDKKTVKLAMRNVNYTYELSEYGVIEYVKFLSGLKYINVSDPKLFARGFILAEILQKIVGK